MPDLALDPARTLVMACATVIEELRPLLPPGMAHQVFDFGLHVNPQNLRRTLQEAIDAVDQQYDIILLGYGLCSMAVVGLKAGHARLVVPRVDDCIAIFLGSTAAYRKQARSEPGTYYLTKGWIEAGDSPFEDYDRMVERFGEARAQRILKAMLGNYKRLALIDTGLYEMDRYRAYTRGLAERFGLRYEELEGSTSLVEKMVRGPWDGDFVVAEPGEALCYDSFVRVETNA